MYFHRRRWHACSNLWKACIGDSEADEAEGGKTAVGSELGSVGKAETGGMDFERLSKDRS